MALHNSALHGKDKIVQLLIEHGADITQCDKNDQTLFHLACQNGNMSMVQYLTALLKEKHSDLLNKSTSDTKTLVFRKSCARGKLEVAEFLLDEFPSLEIDVSSKKLNRTELSCPRPQKEPMSINYIPR